MPNEIMTVVPRLESAQYDGSNGEWIAETFFANGNFQFVDGSGFLYFELGPYQCIVPSGEFVFRQTDQDEEWRGSLSPSNFEKKYVILDPSAIDDPMS